MRKRSIVVALTAVVAATAGPAHGSGRRAVIEVFPGPNAITDAIAVAQPGDTLNIHAGTYDEFVGIDVAGLTLRAAGDGLVTVDGGCSLGTVIDVTADDVSIQGLQVMGAGVSPVPISIDMSFVAGGRIADTVVTDTCGNAEYGINVYHGEGIRIVRNRTSGFSDAGIYIGGIFDAVGPITVLGNETFESTKGIIIEDINNSTVRVLSNFVHDNVQAGIWLNIASGTRVDGNTVRDNGTSGIEVNEFSTGNLIVRNRSIGQTYDVSNLGTGNCWRDNLYISSRGDISC